MNNLKAAEKHGKAMLLMASFAAFILYTAEKRTAQIETTVSISDSSVRAEILNSYSIDLKEIHGIKVYSSDSLSYYFEYEADYNQILNAISLLPVRIDDHRTSIRCGLMNSNSNPMQDFKGLSKTEVSASEFFWKANPEEYTFYECLKGSLKHTLLISKTSAKILHRIEGV